MSTIEWVDTLTVHVDELDEQHRGIIEVINNLHDALLYGKIADLDSARTKALDLMEDRVVSHFKTEEAFMDHIGYPGLDDHREKHLSFLTMLRQYRNDLKDGAILLNSELMKTLGNWFMDHELGEDQKFSSFYLGEKR
jgi:hemerythrin-like metal-binding protein